MVRLHNRAAILVALVNGLVVMVLPILLILLPAVFPVISNSGTTVVGVDPDRVAVRSRQLQAIVVYVTAVSPFAMAAAWRTFVHAKRWLERGDTGWQGILEAGACGFTGALVVLLPGILRRPGGALPYVVAYGGAAAVPGMIVGLLLWTTATAALRLYRRLS